MRRVTIRGILAVLAVVAAMGGLSLAGPAPANAATADFTVVYQQIVSLHSGQCADIPGGSQSQGVKVQQWWCNGTVAQQWTMVATDSGYFELRVAASGQCMQVAGSSQADGARVTQGACVGTYDQQWTLRESGVPGWPFIVARHSGKGLTIASESTDAGAQLVQYFVAPWADGPDTLHASDWQFQ